MAKKVNKIMVAVSPDNSERTKMLHRIAVNCGFARTAGDASKITRPSPYDFDLSNCFFVLAENYNLKDSMVTTQRLFELAASGLAIIIGTRKIPPEMEFLCDVYYPHNFDKL